MTSVDSVISIVILLTASNIPIGDRRRGRGGVREGEKGRERERERERRGKRREGEREREREREGGKEERGKGLEGTERKNNVEIT